MPQPPAHGAVILRSRARTWWWKSSRATYDRGMSKKESLADVLAEWRVELGPATDEEEAWVQDALTNFRVNGR